MELIFFWLLGRSLLIELSTNPNCTKSESYSGNSNISNGVDISNEVNINDGINISDEVDIGDRVDIGNEVNDEIPWADGLPPTDPNRIESKSRSDYCKMCNVVVKEIPLIEEI